MRIVGVLDRSELELQPARAWRRARRLDALLQAAAARRPPGVTRATHAAMNLQDDVRMVESARRLNPR